MGIFTVFFGVLSGCLLSVLVGLVGSNRRIGFGWSFLISLIFTPLVGLICTLLSDPLPCGEKRWGCIGTVVAVLGVVFLVVFAVLLLSALGVVAVTL